MSLFPEQGLDKAWDDCFNETPYTSFSMIEYILNKTGVNHEAFLLEPEILKRHIKAIVDDSTNDFEDLMLLPGRCTSFALQVVKRIEADPNLAQSHDFWFYDFGPHRLACCKTTKCLIDSSSIYGNLFLDEGTWLSADGQRKWMAKEDFSKMKRMEGKILPSRERTRRECMAICLKSLVQEGKNPLCLFREYEDIWCSLMGVVEWQMQERKSQLSNVATPLGEVDDIGITLRLSLDVDRRLKKDKPIYVIWDRRGTSKTQQLCLQLLARFCSDPSIGGTHVLPQWLSCETFHWRMWRAASRLWGYPRLELSKDWYLPFPAPDVLYDKFIKTVRLEFAPQIEDSTQGEEWVDTGEHILTEQFRSYLLGNL